MLKDLANVFLTCLIEVQLMYKVVLVSAVQQSDSDYTFIYVLSHTLFYYDLSQDTYWGFPDSSAGKESACSAGDLGSIPGLGRPPGGRNGYPLQYSCLENSVVGGAWYVTVHRVTKSRTLQRDFCFPFFILQTEKNTKYVTLTSVFGEDIPFHHGHL